MDAIVIEAATEAPVTALEVGQHLNRGDEGVEDLQGKILAAVASIELATGPIMQRTMRMTVRRVPRHRIVYLPAWLVTDVVSVAVVDYDGVSTPLVKDTDYREELDARPGRLVFATVPSGSVVVEYEAGWESADQVPAELKHAVLLEVGHMAAHRESVMQARAGHSFVEVPRAIQHLTAKYAAAVALAWGQD